MRAGFLCPKCDNFDCLHIRQYQNEIHLKRWFFFTNIRIFCKSIAGPFSEAETHWMVNLLQLQNQLYGVIPRYLCKIHLNDASEMFNCWERRWIDVDDASSTLSATAAIIFGCTHSLPLSSLLAKILSVKWIFPWRVS